MSDIFLSYNREDQSRAKLFADAFTAAGLNVWWDTALRSGEAYDEVTEAALRAAKAVVVLWSPRSVVSRWVRAEATIADRCKTLVPVTIEPCERPIMFELTQTADLSHWMGDSADRSWAAFLRDVRGLVGRKAEPALPGAGLPQPEAPTVAETLKPGQCGSAPSLAVLPFTNRSGLTEDEVFAEGMVEDVISALTQGVNVRVLGATTTANLSRAAITDIPALGRQLGVRYLLEGNIRRVGTNLRVTTQLLDAESGTAIWTAKFDRPLSELADLQEELVIEIAANLDTQVHNLEVERALKKPGDITAWEAISRAWSAYRLYDPTAMQLAITEATRAVAIAPDYGVAQAMLAVTQATQFAFTGPNDPAEVQRIRTIAERALALAPDDVMVLAWVGLALSYIGSANEGERYAARAVSKAPGVGTIRYGYAIASVMNGRLEMGLAELKTSLRLMPGAMVVWIAKMWIARALALAERWAEADTAVDEVFALNPSYPHGHVLKALVSVKLGRETEALNHVKTARQLGLARASAEHLYRLCAQTSPSLEADVALIHALYAAAEA
ncbi:TIR domain-containing protein [Sandarakinorhabdus sp. AAP62]|uniref:TIR domain-containing protein n=1 Tax=Sandarakinorhabdus sp. AAP62 TaxID=1248916 RepID=UPI00031C0DE8|nr:TIR domain-containing protein [Sandarakinorhabdus sp. AAP62]